MKCTLSIDIYFLIVQPILSVILVSDGNTLIWPSTQLVKLACLFMRMILQIVFIEFTCHC